MATVIWLSNQWISFKYSDPKVLNVWPQISFVLIVSDPDFGMVSVVWLCNQINTWTQIQTFPTCGPHWQWCQLWKNSVIVGSSCQCSQFYGKLESWGSSSARIIIWPRCLISETPSNSSFSLWGRAADVRGTWLRQRNVYLSSLLLHQQWSHWRHRRVRIRCVRVFTLAHTDKRTNTSNLPAYPPPYIIISTCEKGILNRQSHAIDTLGTEAVFLN